MSNNRIMKKLTVMSVVALILTGIITTVAMAAPKLSKTKVTVKIDSAVTIKIKGGKAAGKWKVKNAKVAKIKKSTKTYAKVVGLKAGKTALSVKIGKKTCKCALTVKEAPKLSAKKVSLKIGDTRKIKISGTAKKVTWKSLSPKIATVIVNKKNPKAAVVKAVGSGNTTIVVQAGKKKVKCVVTVAKEAGNSNNDPEQPVSPKKKDDITPPAPVKPEGPTLASIEVEALISEFEKGRTFTNADFLVTAIYSDGTIKPVTDFQLDAKVTTEKEANGDETGKCVATVTYGGKTATAMVPMEKIIADNKGHTYYASSLSWNTTIDLNAGKSRDFEIQTYNVGEEIDPNIKFLLSNNHAELANDGKTYTGTTDSGYGYMSVTVKAISEGNVTLTAKSGSNIIATTTIKVIGNDTGLLSYRQWIADVEAKVWTPNMSKYDKLKAFGDYIVQHDDGWENYEDTSYMYSIYRPDVPNRGNNCDEVAQTMIAVAKQLGLKGELYQVKKGSMIGHYFAKIWLDDGIAYLFDASGVRSNCQISYYEAMKSAYE